jgi:diguanylate cyclase (GGDEF)-like protein/PAS domain S-box-containing protein
MFENTGTAVAIIERDTTIATANSLFRSLVGYTGETLDGKKSWKDFVASSTDLERMIDFHRQRRDAPGSTPNRYECAIVDREGNRKYVLLHVDVIPGTDRSVVSVIDLTERKHVEKALVASQERLQNVIENTRDVIFQMDLEGNFVFSNKAAERVTGYSLQQLLCMNMHDLVAPEYRDWVSKRMSDRKSGRAAQTPYEFEILHARGYRVWVELITNGVYRDGELVGVQGSCRDVTERKHFEETLNHMAYYDQLTGLPNRTLFYDRLDQAMARARRYNSLLAVMLIDVDRLKAVNDTLGHSLGDQLIFRVAQRLAGATREGDTLARIGGDEFAYLAEGLKDGDHARSIGERMQASVNRSCSISGMEVVPGISVGYSLYPDNGGSRESLLQLADLAMYNAKGSTNCKVQGYAPEQGTMICDRFRMEQELRRALERKEFAVYYQPHVEMKDFTVIGMEALIRWNHPERGLVEPNRFVPLLEEINLIGPIGDWVLRMVCAQIRAWGEAGMPRKLVSVNLSAHQLLDPGLAETIDDMLAEKGIAPESIALEITETAAMHDMETATRVLRSLSRRGIWILLDDFGKGYSSLNSLRQFSVDTVKICRSFVTGVPENKENATITKAIIAMAHNLGKSVLAEGVETARQAEYLSGIGCDYAQGYYFGKPVPPSQMPSRWFEQGRGEMGEGKAGEPC